jgi:hypothetical protein
VSVIVVLDSIIAGTLLYPHSFSLSLFLERKYIERVIDKYIERVIMWTSQSPFYKKVRGLSINFHIQVNT